MKKFIKSVLINLLVFALILEVVSIIYIKIKKPVNSRYDEIPTYLNFTLNDVYDTLPDPLSPKIIDTLYTWSTWHPKNRIHRQVSPCFDVLLKFNEMGTRGSLPNPEDSGTIFFLGDSFAEGFGMEEDSTISERMRKRLNKPVLNLGSTGSIGSTQISLIYSEFAKHFKHEEVYVLFYLHNDFTDNDIAMHDKKYPNRYRPYRVLINNDSSKIIYKGSLDSTTLSWKQFDKEKKAGFIKFKKYGLRSFLFKTEGNFVSKLTKLSYSRRFINFVITTLRNDGWNEAGEISFSPGDWRILEIDIESILATASRHKAKVSFINLPSMQLLSYSGKTERKVEQYRQMELKLKDFVAKKGGRYLSFYNYLAERKLIAAPIFFPCDAHYSNYGNQLLSDFILANYSNK